MKNVFEFEEYVCTFQSVSIWSFIALYWWLTDCNISFSEGSNLTPAHHFPDFRLKSYAPLAFRYFRELFGIKPDDYLVSLQIQAILQIRSNSLWHNEGFSHLQDFGKPKVILHQSDSSIPSVTNLWFNCPTLVPAIPGSTSPVTMNLLLKQYSIKRLSSCKSCFLGTTW